MMQRVILVILFLVVVSFVFLQLSVISSDTTEQRQRDQRPQGIINVNEFVNNNEHTPLSTATSPTINYEADEEDDEENEEVVNVEEENDNDEEMKIVMKEMEWAEHAMENYKRNSGSGTYPLRSSINAPHVHTNEWKQDSINNVFSDLLVNVDHRQQHQKQQQRRRSRRRSRSKNNQNNDDDNGDDIVADNNDQTGNLRRST